MKDCKIIQDLLPNYMEGLTNDETNQYVEEHLKNCDECNRIFKDMKMNLDENQEKAEIKEVNYLKKYNRKLRIFMGIVFIIIFIFIFGFVRKLIIYHDLQEKLAVCQQETNYYVKVTNYSEGHLEIMQKFQKGDKYMIRDQNLYADGTEMPIYKVYVKHETANMYCSDSDGKQYAELNVNKENTLNIDIPDFWKDDKENFFQYLKMVLFSSVTTESCNGKDCYKITKRNSLDKNFEEYIYIEKETGLAVRIFSSFQNRITDYKYLFGSVTDNTLKEPDISECEIIEIEE